MTANKPEVVELTLRITYADGSSRELTDEEWAWVDAERLKCHVEPLHPKELPTEGLDRQFVQLQDGSGHIFDAPASRWVKVFPNG